MKINQQDFDSIKHSAISLYFDARNSGEVYVMEFCDWLLSILTKVEQENIKQKQSLL